MPILPGLDPARFGDTPAARRAAIRATPEDALGDALAALARALRASRADAEAVASLSGAPRAEVLASPFGLRAVGLGLEVGPVVVSQERRVCLPWPEGWMGGVEVEDGEHGMWDRGRLHLGKYESFLQDDRTCMVNPAHVAKWTPHEFLHRAARWFWREDMTKWELYLGARLNELVPVVLWYGPDECLRGAGLGFDRVRDGVPRTLNDADLGWLLGPEGDVDALARRTACWLIEGVAHFDRELEAIDRELETSRPVRVPHAFLDASSDAIAYVVGHYRRLTGASHVALHRGLLREGVDWEPSVRSYRGRIEALMDRLLFGEVRVDPAAVEVERRRSFVLDQARRWLQQEPATERRVEKAVAGWASALARTGWDPIPGPRRATARETAAMVPAGDGRLGAPLTVAEREQIVHGLTSVVPALLHITGLRGEADLAAFVASPHGGGARGPLGHRYGAWAAEATGRSEYAVLGQFEELLSSLGCPDDGIERLQGEAPEAWVDGEGTFVGNASFRVVELARDVAPMHEASEADRRIPEAGGPARYLIGTYLHTICVVPAPEGVAELFEASLAGPIGVNEALTRLGLVRATPGTPSDAEGWLAELLGAGVLGWIPKAR